MRYALTLPNGGECSDPRTLASFAARAEVAGWDAVFLEDYIVYENATYHSIPGSPTHDPWVALSAMAVSTERVKLGTSVSAPARRRPWKLARETTSLDHLSNGRVILGVGLGDVRDKGFAAMGEVTDARRRVERLDEGLEIIAGLWSGQPFSYRGAHYTVEEVTFLPTPIQSPRVPIWVGGGWPRKGPVRRAARWDGACFYKDTSDGAWQDMTPADVRALGEAIHEQRTAATPFDLMLGGQQRHADWVRERDLRRSLAEAGATWWNEWVPAAPRDVMERAIERGPLRID